MINKWTPHTDPPVRVLQVQVYMVEGANLLYCLCGMTAMMPVIMLVVLRMVKQEQLSTFIRASKDYAS